MVHGARWYEVLVRDDGGVAAAMKIRRSQLRHSRLDIVETRVSKTANFYKRKWCSREQDTAASNRIVRYFVHNRSGRCILRLESFFPRERYTNRTGGRNYVVRWESRAHREKILRDARQRSPDVARKFTWHVAEIL